MKGFRERTRAFEAKFAREQEYEFIVNLKACRILAKNIAEEKLDLKSSAVKRYCDKIIDISVRNCDRASMYKYIQKRLKKNNIAMSNEELESRYKNALAMAKLNMPSTA